MHFYSTLILSFFNSSNEEAFCAGYWTIPQCQWWPKASQRCQIKNWFLSTAICLCLSGHYISSAIQTSNLHTINERKFIWLEFLDSICLPRRWELSLWTKILINLIDNPQRIKIILSNREKLTAAEVLQLTGWLVCWWEFLYLETFLICLKQTWRLAWPLAGLLCWKTSAK